MAKTKFKLKEENQKQQQRKETTKNERSRF